MSPSAPLSAVTFADTDLILKLTAFDLFEDTLEMFGVSPEQVFIFREEVRRVCLHNREVIAEYPKEVLNTVVMFANFAQPINTAIDPEEQFYLSESEGIDGGEQVIFGATRHHKNFRVLTGDKKALRALATANGCGGIQRRMKGRVFCLEQILLLLIARLGYATVRDRILPLIRLDDGIGKVFATGKSTSQQDAEKELMQQIERLRLEARDLLAITTHSHA